MHPSLSPATPTPKSYTQLVTHPLANALHPSYTPNAYIQVTHPKPTPKPPTQSHAPIGLRWDLGLSEAVISLLATAFKYLPFQCLHLLNKRKKGPSNMVNHKGNLASSFRRSVWSFEDPAYPTLCSQTDRQAKHCSKQLDSIGLYFSK